MTRADLASKLSLRLNISKKEADKYLLSFLEAISNNLLKEKRVVVQGFGSFHLREYGARVGKKPMTGEPLALPNRKKPIFHAGKELKEMINNNSKPVRTHADPPRRAAAMYSMP